MICPFLLLLFFVWVSSRCVKKIKKRTFRLEKKRKRSFPSKNKTRTKRKKKVHTENSKEEKRTGSFTAHAWSTGKKRHSDNPSHRSLLIAELSSRRSHQQPTTSFSFFFFFFICWLALCVGWVDNSREGNNGKKKKATTSELTPVCLTCLGRNPQRYKRKASKKEKKKKETRLPNCVRSHHTRRIGKEG